MPGVTLQKFSLSGLARATQSSLDWKNWGQGPRRLEQDGPPSQEVLEKLIEGEIIPRLMLTTREPASANGVAEVRGGRALTFSADDIDAFARLALESDPGSLVAEVERIMDAGGTHQDILLKLLAPTARRLGKMWDDDTCDFADVTIGLMKLHRVLEQVNCETPSGLGQGGRTPRVLLAAAPGEQHVFGVLMVAEFFHRSGWRVYCDTTAEADHLVESAACDEYDVIGLSASGSVDPKALKALVRDIRSASSNPDLVIMAGGHAFNEDIELARRIGADATAADGVRAVVAAERMVHRLARAGRALQA
jgi:methanogenic corrinoid protein MtbC1